MCVCVCARVCVCVCVLGVCVCVRCVCVLTGDVLAFLTQPLPAGAVQTDGAAVVHRLIVWCQDGAVHPPDLAASRRS